MGRTKRTPMKWWGASSICLVLTACYGSTGITGIGHGDSSVDDAVSPETDVPIDTTDAFTDDSGDISPPDIPDDSPCCVLVGDPVEVSEDEFPGGPIDMAWNGSGWGVVWGDFERTVAFRPLDADGVPVGPLVGIGHISSLFPVIEWGDDRYAIVGGPPYDESISMALVDGSGALLYASPWSIEGGHNPEIDWWPDEESWLIVYDLLGDRTIEAVRAERNGGLLGEPVEVGHSTTFEGPVIVAHKDRTAIVWPMPDGIWYRSFEWDHMEEAPPANLLLPSFSLTSASYVDAVAYRESTFIAYLDGEGSAMVAVVDAATDEVIAGPTAVGETMIGDRRPGLAPAPSLGGVGMCYEIGPHHAGGGGGNAVGFRLLDASGNPLGEPLAVATDIEDIGDCAVGWTGSEFVVSRTGAAGETRPGECGRRG